MRSSLLTLFILFSPGLYSQDICEIENKSAKVKVELGEEVPEFFFKVIMPQNKDDQRDEVTAILAGKGNVLIDMRTGNIRKIPGLYDAVPSIDARIVTIPGNPENRNHFTIYSRDNLEKPIYQDKGMNGLLGVYQSVGMISTKPNERTYRVITDTITMVRVDGTENPAQLTKVEIEDGREIQVKYPDKLHYKDYTVYENNVVDGSSSPKPLCPNIEILLKLPMLSKDGKKLAAYNVETGTTNIFKVLPDGKCDLEKDLGFTSTKVEFNDDGSKITFAVDSISTTHDSVQWYSQPKRKTMKMNVYVLDLNTDHLTKVTDNKLGSSYYPSFSKDDTVTYLQQDFPQGLDHKGSYSLVRSKIDTNVKTNFRNADFYSFDSCLYRPEDLAIIALGKLWINTCQNIADTPIVLASKAIALSLEPKKCRELVTNYWENNKNSFTKDFVTAKDVGVKTKNSEHIAELNFENLRRLSKDDLLKACPTSEVKKEEIDVKKAVLVGSFGGGNILFNKCAGCHSSGSGREFVVDRARTIKKHKNTAINHIKSGYMPMGDHPLTDKEKNEILEYLNRF